MIPALTLMLAAYIVTQMVVLLDADNPPGVYAAAWATILVAVAVVLYVLFVAPR